MTIEIEYFRLTGVPWQNWHWCRDHFGEWLDCGQRDSRLSIDSRDGFQGLWLHCTKTHVSYSRSESPGNSRVRDSYLSILCDLRMVNSMDVFHIDDHLADFGCKISVCYVCVLFFQIVFLFCNYFVSSSFFFQVVLIVAILFYNFQNKIDLIFIISK